MFHQIYQISILQGRCSLPSFKKYHDILKIFFSEFHLVNHKHNSHYEEGVSGKQYTEFFFVYDQKVYIMFNIIYRCSRR